MGKVTTARTSKAIVVVKSLLVSYVITAVILLILSFVMYKFDPPSAVISIGIIITYIVSCFIGGFLLGSVTKEKRFLWGIGMGAIYFAIILVVSIIFSKDAFGDFGSTISVFFMCALGGMLGGMVS